jgi:hypothetical protein
MDTGLWPQGAALGACGWLCVGLCDWRWLGRYFGGLVVVMTKDEALERKAENARELGLDYEPDIKYPSYCCQKCGELIGWLGRAMPFHKCKEKNT